MVDNWKKLDEYIAQAVELIRQTFNYSEMELMNKHEVEFFRILYRAEKRNKERARAMKPRKKK